VWGLRETVRLSMNEVGLARGRRLTREGACRGTLRAVHGRSSKYVPVF